MFTLYTFFVTLLYLVLIAYHICLMHALDFRLYKHKISLYMYVNSKSPYIQKCLLYVPFLSAYIIKYVIHKILYYSTSYTSNTPDSLGVPYLPTVNLIYLIYVRLPNKMFRSLKCCSFSTVY